MHKSDLLSIGQTAILLRSSRRHVLDLCARGLLPYVSVGTHRRIRRADVEAFIRPTLSRSALEQLWLHQAIAGRFVSNPTAVLAAATINLRRLRRINRGGAAWEWLDRWQVVLDSGPDAVLEALTSPSDSAVELRKASPFTGVLSEMERQTVLTALAESRRDRARPVSVETLERVMRAV
jgi:excisionase family DNA binding protein